jgi:putative ABC transport system substrate-binding protein
LGYGEGQNLAIEWRLADGRLERLPDLAAELVALPVDLIVGAGAPAAIAAKGATDVIPIVAVLPLGNLVGVGLAASLARPGGNVTGLHSQVEGINLWTKRCELLQEIVPAITCVVMPWNSPRLGSARTADLIPTAENLLRLGLQFRYVEVPEPEALDGVFEMAIFGQADALAYSATDNITAHHARVAGLALRGRLPSVTDAPGFVRLGGLMAYAPNSAALHRCSATYVDKILKGAKPADLPVEQPTKFDFVINLKTAQALGLTIPPSVLVQATEIIE